MNGWQLRSWAYRLDLVERPGWPSSGVQLAVLLVLVHHANDHQVAWPSVRTIAAESRWSRAIVTRALDALQAQCFIVPDGKRSGGRRATRWRLLVDVQPSTGEAVDDGGDDDEPPTGEAVNRLPGRPQGPTGEAPGAYGVGANGSENGSTNGSGERAPLPSVDDSLPRARVDGEGPSTSAVPAQHEPGHEGAGEGESKIDRKEAAAVLRSILVRYGIRRRPPSIEIDEWERGLAPYTRSQVDAALERWATTNERAPHLPDVIRELRGPQPVVEQPAAIVHRPTDLSDREYDAKKRRERREADRHPQRTVVDSLFGDAPTGNEP